MGMDLAGCGETFYDETQPFLPPADTESARSAGRMYRQSSDDASQEKETATAEVVAV